MQFSISIVSMKKTVLFQTTQFSIQKQLYFKQFSLALVCSLNLKTVLFRTIQFSLSTEFSSIWPIDRTLSDLPLQARVNLEAMAMNGYSKFPQAPALLEPHYQVV